MTNPRSMLALAGAFLVVACARTSLEPAPVSWKAKSAARRVARPVAGAVGGPVELVLERAVPIEAAEDFQPSGLALWRGRLLAVSDKHDHAVFELVLSGGVARAEQFVALSIPAQYSSRLDLEGLCVRGDGELALVSEAHSGVLLVDAQGRARWLGSVSLPKKDLLQVPNAGLEGVAALPDGSYLLAAERKPRGLIQVDASMQVLSSWVMNEPTEPPVLPRDPDFSDLATFEGSVFALERNAHVVVRLTRGPGGWSEAERWSFRRTENDPALAYDDATFARAEGLAIDAQRVYVVLDNNQDPRERDPNDKRALLLVFMRPVPGGSRHRPNH